MVVTSKFMNLLSLCGVLHMYIVINVHIVQLSDFLSIHDNLG